MKLGYACINSTLQQTGGITTNRGMRQKTFNERGLDYVSELALQNCRDLVTIVKWNEEMGIKLFRMSSDLFPWMTFYDFTDLPDYDKIVNLLKGVGKLADKYGQRLTFHPSHFNALGSPNPTVVEKTIKELNKHGEIMDIMGLSTTVYNKINIHIAGAYGDKQATLDRWISNYHLLNDNTKMRLTVENDDKANMYSVKELYEGVYKKCGVPIVFDYYHHKFCTGDLSERDALNLAIKTWPKDITPCCHYSESRRKEHLDESIKAQAHSDLIEGTICRYGNEVDVVVEAKHKELAVLNYYKLGNL
jgi:UV DNA damage endonuclease